MEYNKDNRRINENRRDYNMKDMIRDFFDRDWTLEEKILMLVNCALAGMILGFLISPVKKGLSVGSHNGSANNIDYGDRYHSGLDEWEE